MEGPRSPIDFVAPYCDLAERIALVPLSARARGLYFRNIEIELERREKLTAYRLMFPDETRRALSYYSLADYLVRLACAGALVASPERVHEGMFEIMRGNAVHFSKSLLGRSMIRLLAKDPIRLTEQGLAARRQAGLSSGHWEIVRHGPKVIEMVYREEYVWIESAIAGAAQGTFEACGLTPALETRLIDRFSGSTLIRW